MAKKSKKEKREAKGGKKKKATVEDSREDEDQDGNQDETVEMGEDEIVTTTQEKLEKTMNYLKHSFSQLRTGRAMPGMLDNVQVEAYGSNMALNTLATVSVRGAQQLVVSLHDQSIVNDVEKAIRECGLSLNPLVQANNTIQVQIPKLTKEVRQQVMKLVAKHAEDAKQAARNNRKQMLDIVKKSFASEDERRRMEKVVQKEVDSLLESIDQLKKQKEQDIEST